MTTQALNDAPGCQGTPHGLYKSQEGGKMQEHFQLPQESWIHFENIF